MSLKDRTFSAVRWTALAAVFRSLLSLLQLAVLTRLLALDDYGLMAMVGVVLALAGVFSDFGVNSAFVQRRDVTPEQRSSLFWFNVLLSAALALVVVGASPLLADFFGDARLAPVMMLSASMFVITALGAQVRMAAEKELAFRPVVLVDLAAALLGFVVALLAALAGWGVYALVAAGISSALASTAMAWMFLAQGWRPMWLLGMKEVKPFLGFGGALMGASFLNQVNLMVDLFLGARLLSASQLGLYSVPRNLALQVQFTINPIITRVGFPLIAQVQGDIAAVRSIYLKTLNMTSATNAPVYLGMAFFSEEIVSLLLGTRWSDSGDILRILALWGAMRSTGNPVGSLLLGMGRPDLAMKWSLSMLVLLPPAIWVGSWSGPEGLAWAMLAFYIAYFVPAWFVLVRPVCHAGLQEYAVAALWPFFLAALAIAPAYWVANFFESAVLRLVVGAAVAAPAYLALGYAFNREWFTSMRVLLGKPARS